MKKLEQIRKAAENERYRVHMGSIISPKVFEVQCSLILKLCAALEKAVSQRNHFIKHAEPGESNRVKLQMQHDEMLAAILKGEAP